MKTEKLVKCPLCHGTRWVGLNVVMPQCQACQETMLDVVIKKEGDNGRR